MPCSQASAQLSEGQQAFLAAILHEATEEQQRYKQQHRRLLDCLQVGPTPAGRMTIHTRMWQHGSLCKAASVAAPTGLTCCAASSKCTQPSVTACGCISAPVCPCHQPHRLQGLAQQEGPVAHEAGWHLESAELARQLEQTSMCQAALHMVFACCFWVEGAFCLS